VAEGNRHKLGDFELISRLGQGGMGAVYKARQKGLDRLVALKVLPQSLARDSAYTERFLREARAAGRLSHPNIVAGISAGFANGYHYFAMEYVNGQNLGDRVLQSGRIAEREAAGIGAQIADGLDHAHRAGLVHRDVKPENIMVTVDGQAKLCDLGLVRGGGEDLRLTQAGIAVGTPYYISPEQACGKEADARSDIYSLGCTLYHLAAGRPPFEADNALAVMQKHLAEAAVPLSEIDPAISPAFEAVVARMMAKKAPDRHQGADEVAGELRRIAAGEAPEVPGEPRPVRGSARHSRIVTTATRALRTTRGSSSLRAAGNDRERPGTASTQPLSPVARRRRSGSFPLIAAGLATAVLVACLAVFVLSRGDRSNASGRLPPPPSLPEDPTQPAPSDPAGRPAAYSAVWTKAKPRGLTADGRAGGLPRWRCALGSGAFDTRRGRCLLYGGEGSNELWAYDAGGDTWTCLLPDDPGADGGRRPGHGPALLAYEAGQDRLYVLLGIGPSRPQKQAQLWAGDMAKLGWTKLKTPDIPLLDVSRDGPNNCMSTFGFPGPAGEMLLVPARLDSPPGRLDPGTGSWRALPANPGGGLSRGTWSIPMDLGPARGEGGVLFFGGLLSWKTDGRTWLLDPASGSWTETRPARSPSPRAWAMSAYNARLGVWMLVGGVVIPPGKGWLQHEIAPETWIYDFGLNTWIEAVGSPAPAQKRPGLFWYDPVHDSGVLLVQPDTSADVETWRLRLTPGTTTTPGHGSPAVVATDGPRTSAR
jgi:serine/threonine protein kinase